MKNVVQDLTSGGLDWQREKWKGGFGSKYIHLGEKMAAKWADVAPDMNDGMGTSLVLIRTEKGKDVFEKLSDSMKLKEVSYEEGVRGNPAEYKSCARPLQRDTFFDDMHSMSFEELEKKYAAPIKVSFLTKGKQKVKKVIKKALRVIGGRA